MADTFCPATMCPLIAPNGSPWTGDVNAKCEREPCGWWHNGRCQGSQAAYEQAAELTVGGNPLVFLEHSDRVTKPTTYYCVRAHECQWQHEAPTGFLCPPRFALLHGLDPRVCLY